MNSASTLIVHRLADPEVVASRAGTRQKSERSHQLDPSGAIGMGSLRIQDTYRVDPNDLRGLPTGIAYVLSGGRAAKVAVARAATALACADRHDEPDGDGSATDAEQQGSGPPAPGARAQETPEPFACRPPTEQTPTGSSPETETDGVKASPPVAAAGATPTEPSADRTGSPYAQGL